MFKHFVNILAFGDLRVAHVDVSDHSDASRIDSVSNIQVIGEYNVAIDISNGRTTFVQTMVSSVMDRTVIVFDH